MTATARSLACALAASTGFGAIAAGVFTVALALLPQPRSVADALTRVPTLEPSPAMQGRAAEHQETRVAAR